MQSSLLSLVGHPRPSGFSGLHTFLEVVTQYNDLMRGALQAHHSYEVLRHQCDVELTRRGLARQQLVRTIHAECF
jgi:hypothetical protein